MIKTRKSTSTNTRNGYSNKKLKNSFGEASINVPRDRDGSFDPVLVPKRKGMAEGIENVIISMYAKGMSNQDIEEQIRKLYDINVSTSTISRITDTIAEDIVAWRKQTIGPCLSNCMDGWNFF